MGGGQCAPFNINYNIRRQGNNLILADGGIEFNQVPNNNAAVNVFHPLSIAPGNPSIHIITSSPTVVPYDRYFNTILRENTTETWPPNNTLDAKHPFETAYNDGKYIIEIGAFDVDYNNNPNNEINDNNDIDANVLIDNFMPYIKKVRVGYGYIYSPPTSYFYEAEWQWNNTQNLLEMNVPTLNGVVIPNQAMIIEVTPSEPMSEELMSTLQLNIDLLNINHLFPLYIENGIYYFLIDIYDWPYSYYINEEFIMEFYGNDLAGNSLLTFDYPLSPTESYLQPLPIRQNQTDWLPVFDFAGTTAFDDFHRFNFGCYNGNGKDIGDCLIADFEVSPDISNGVPISMLGQTGAITFTNTSSSNATSFYWDFGNGNTSYLESPPPVTYSAAGVYDVILEVEDNLGLTNLRSIEISVYNLNANPPPASFTYEFISNYEVQFTYNGPDPTANNFDLSWNFDDPQAYSNTSNETNPIHEFSGQGDYNVTLIASNQNGYSDATEQVTVSNTGQLSSITCQASEALWSTTTDIWVDVFTNTGTTLFYEYDIDFGDGNTYNEITYSDFINATHTYQSNGTYTYSATVRDVNSNDIIGECTGEITMGFNPISANFSITPQGVLNTNSVVQFTDLSAGEQYSLVWLFEKKDANGNYQYYDAMSGTMNGEISQIFSIGEYKVTLYIDNWIGSDEKTNYFEIEDINTSIQPEIVIADFWPCNIQYASLWEYFPNQCGFIPEYLYSIVIPIGTEICFMDESYISEEYPNYPQSITHLKILIEKQNSTYRSFKFFDIDDYPNFSSFTELTVNHSHEFNTEGTYYITWTAWNDEEPYIEFDNLLYTSPACQDYYVGNYPNLSTASSKIVVFDCTSDEQICFDNNVIPSGNVRYDWEGSITIPGSSCNTAVVSPYGKCYLEAGNKINLMPGFKAEPNSKFTADIIGCDTQYEPCPTMQNEQIDNTHEPLLPFELSISPNPGYGQFIVDIISCDCELVNYIIYNSLGQVIKSGDINIEQSTRIDLTKQVSGIYSFIVYTNEDIHKYKLVKL